jgi:tetratricopeptide (TPR) repeat protein
LAKDPDLYEIANKIEDSEGKEKFYEYIRTTFGWYLNDIEWKIILDKAKDEAVSVIPKLFKGPIITSNFDQILEKIHNIALPVYLPHDIKALEKLTDVIKEKKHSIYKVHGSVSDVEKIVFTGKSYTEAYRSDSDLVKTLSKFYQGFCFLFLGSSLKMSREKIDKSVKLWTDLTNSGMFHYAILACGKENENELKKQKIRREELEKQKIKPIFFPQDKFESIKIILDELLTRVKDSYLKIPTYESHFVERTFLKDIEDKLSTIDISTLVITEHKSNIAKTTLKGMGGIGKTRLACEYAKKHEKEYLSGVYFINAFSKENVHVQVYQFAIEKNLIDKEEKNQSVILEKVKKWMKENDNWLFILDNVEHYKNIEDLLKYDTDIFVNSKRHFIITSRKTYPQLEDIDLTVFNEVEAKEFFRTHTGKDFDTGLEPDKYAESIAKELGYLPLALEQAASYIKKHKKSYQEYYKLIKMSLLEILRKGDYESETLPVQATFNISIRMIENEETKQLLNLCSFFAPDNIHCSWFIDANKQLKSYSPSLQEKIKNNEEYKKILNELAEYSLVRIEDNKISIHRLTQEVVKKSLKDKDDNEQKKWINCCIDILDKQRNSDFSKAELRSLFTEMTPHILSVTVYPCLERQEEVANLYVFLGYGFVKLANYDEALKYFQKALAVWKKLLGIEHPSTAASYNHIGFVYYNQGDYANALEYYQNALDIREKVLGKEHFDIAISYNNIGGIYNEQGDYPKALEYYQKALEIQEKVLGKEHLDTAISYNNIGGIYNRQGDYANALKYFQMALDIREKLLGKEHPDTARSYNNIGIIYNRQGNYLNALEYDQKALAIQEKVLGKEHPDTATSYNNIGFVYYNQGNYPKALEYYQMALDIYENVLGKEHPDTAISYNNIGGIYNEQGDYPKALKYYQMALDIYKNVLGKEHPSTARSYINIGGIYYYQGNYPKALKYYQMALNIYENVLGKEHPDTATSYNNIGGIYNEQGDYPKALKYYQMALDIYEKILGKKHPNTLLVLENIGDVCNKTKLNKSFKERVKRLLKSFLFRA